MTDRFVLDTSVVAKWYLNDEELIAEAEGLLVRLLAGEIEVHAPEIMRYEMGHMLTKAQRQQRRPLNRTESEQAYRFFCSLPITFHQLDDSQRQGVLAFANTFSRGFYDSCYSWLAGSLGCKWLTDDRRFGGALPPGYPAERILTLASQTRSPQ